MLATALALTLAAAPPLIKLAAPRFQCVHVEPEVCSLYGDTFAQLLGEGGVRVTTEREIAEILGLERRKQLLGCAEDSSACVAELAGALGVDGVVTGSVGKLGSAYTVNVKIVSARDGSSMGARSGRVKDDDELHAWFVDAGHQLAEGLVRSRTRNGGLRTKAWIPWVGGGLAVGAGAVFVALGNADAKTISVPSSREPENFKAVEALRSEGQGKQAAGVALFAVGAAAALVGAGFFLFGAPSETAVSLQLNPQLMGLSLSGVFP